MREDYWTNSKTNTTLNVSGALGSPRAWLKRALDTATLDDTVFQPNSITPTEISVAGIWYRPCSIPITGMHRELFRRFDIPEPEQIMRPRTRVPLVPAIGVCAAVPMHEVLHWIKIYKAHGAEYTWWNTPVDRSMRAADPSAGKAPRRQLDHAVVYSMLDSGKTLPEIAKQLNFPRENISYVVKKWRAGLPLYEKFAKPRIDARVLLQDHMTGASPKELADKYTTSLAYVYKLIQQQKDLS